MRVLYRASFARAFKDLPAASQADVREAQSQLANVFGRPHLHAGIGIRRIGQFFEFRAGLKLRVIFLVDQGDAVLLTVGNHDQVARWIRDNA